MAGVLTPFGRRGHVGAVFDGGPENLLTIVARCVKMQLKELLPDEFLEAHYPWSS